MDMGKGTNMKYIQRMLLQWYELLQWLFRMNRVCSCVNLGRTEVYGPYLLLLDVEKISDDYFEYSA